MTLGMAFSGQVLRFDQGRLLGIGNWRFDRESGPPFAGPMIVKLMLGGARLLPEQHCPDFFALHVFVIPGMLYRFRLSFIS